MLMSLSPVSLVRIPLTVNSPCMFVFVRRIGLILSDAIACFVVMPRD